MKGTGKGKGRERCVAQHMAARQQSSMISDWTDTDIEVQIGPREPARKEALSLDVQVWWPG